MHVDAHPDLYPSFAGNRYSHACPFARILEDTPVRSLLQIGIRMRVISAIAGPVVGGDVVEYNPDRCCAG